MYPQEVWVTSAQSLPGLQDLLIVQHLLWELWMLHMLPHECKRHWGSTTRGHIHTPEVWVPTVPNCQSASWCADREASRSGQGGGGDAIRESSGSVRPGFACCCVLYKISAPFANVHISFILLSKQTPLCQLLFSPADSSHPLWRAQSAVVSRPFANWERPNKYSVRRYWDKTSHQSYLCLQLWQKQVWEVLPGLLT